ncbi:MAG: UDP-3-O-(3-hydroxymyristoyl)glucosamine N-acyltransferase [Gammaproteobacteria bacterium]|nr:UDP-3-O-(3-hydroxymyristoyl)glucosamine N-acyltransferase [Gammaproteobacteria bacterium]
MGLTLGELAGVIGAELRGDPDIRVEQVATLQRAGKGDVGFLTNSRYRKYLQTTGASGVILAPRDADASPIPVLVKDNPYLGYALAARALNPTESFSGGIHADASVSERATVHPSAWVGPQAVVESGAKIGAGTFIGPHCRVGRDVTIGDQVRLVAGVTLCHSVEIGSRVLIQPGAVIGADGFGFANDEGEWVKIPQVGGVVIGDDVEVGANTTIDRGALDNTVIEAGAKLDNQIQIAHNVRIGAQTAIAGCVGVAGSTNIGKNCTVGGGVGIVGHLEIGDNVHLTACSVVFQSIKEPGLYSSGLPLQENRQWRRNYSRLKQLDEMMQRIRKLEKIMDEE